MQRSLLEESIDEDLQDIELELEALRSAPEAAPPLKDKPRRVMLPAGFPRVEFQHEPEYTQCTCGCALDRFVEDVSEKLDCLPGIFQVHRHVRCKWVCRRCEKLIQAPVPPHRSSTRASPRRDCWRTSLWRSMPNADIGISNTGPCRIWDYADSFAEALSHRGSQNAGCGIVWRLQLVQERQQLSCRAVFCRLTIDRCSLATQDQRRGKSE